MIEVRQMKIFKHKNNLMNNLIYRAVQTQGLEIIKLRRKEQQLLGQLDELKNRVEKLEIEKKCSTDIRIIV